MILFRADIHKAPAEYSTVASRMRKILNAKSPQLVRFLFRLWKAQSKDFTYAEIRQALLDGHITQATIESWRQSYATLINEEFVPAWKEVIRAAEQQLIDRYPDYLYNPGANHIKAWTEQRAAEMIVDITQGQRTAINGVIQRYVQVPDIGVDAMARLIRPMVGLYPQQATANYRYFNKVKETIREVHPRITQQEVERRATESAIKYAAKQQAYRAEMIARTEIINAYNNGELGAVQQAIHEGKMGKTKKRWVTGGDERVCDICARLDGVEVPMDEMFPGGYEAPTAHPHCRCVLAFIEEE